MDTKELRKSLKDGSFYDYIAEHYSELTKWQLKELILNLDWVATEGIYSSPAATEFYGKLEEELENRDFFAD